MIKIHNKNYIEVKDRVKHFRDLDQYDGWSIETNIIEISAEKIITKTVICDEVGKVMSTGIAYEMANSSHINKTSYIENCETSSVGRALGFLGIGIDGSIASADEVENAIAQQSKDKKPKGNVETQKQAMENCTDKKELTTVYQSLSKYEWNEDETVILKNAVKLVAEKFDGELIDG